MPRDWNAQMRTQWASWEPLLENARRSGARNVPADLPFPLDGPDKWIRHPPGWVCCRRGLGFFARLALVSGHVKRNWWRKAMPITPLHPKFGKTVVELLKAFDSQRHKVKQTRKRLQTLDRTPENNKKRVPALDPEAATYFLRRIDDRALWSAIAYALDSSSRHESPLSAKVLMHGHFDGPSAVADFRRYLNTGIVPVWQAPFPDHLSSMPEAKGHVPDDAPAVIQTVADALLEETDKPEHERSIPHYCLYSELQPRDLPTAALQIIRAYVATAIRKERRRLPIVYVPVGVGAQDCYVSRRGVVRDLYTKLCRERAEPNAANRVPEFPEDATGEQIDNAVAAIRKALTGGTLLIFGVHHVLPPPPEESVIGQKTDSPLPFILQRLMPEPGSLADPIPVEAAYASRVLILADAPMKSISHHRVDPHELPSPTADAFERTQAQVEAYADYVLERARHSEEEAWFATIFFVVTIVPGGVREETIARVLAGYIVSTSSATPEGRPAWSPKIEAALWTPTPRPEGRHHFTLQRIEAFRSMVYGHIQAFKERTTALIRGLASANVGEIDAHPHYFESAESPAFHFTWDSFRKQLDFWSPALQSLFAERFKKALPEKHTLLRLLLADEFTRRAAMVHRHSRDRESLVEKRYLIAAIYQSLNGLGHDRCDLLREEGERHWRWLIEPRTARDTFQWIYRELYAVRLNGAANLLSRQLGAEHLKLSLIAMFTRARARVYGVEEQAYSAQPRWMTIEEFDRDISLQRGRVLAGVHSIDDAVVVDALREYDAHIRAARSHLIVQREAVDKEHWQHALHDAERDVLKLRLDGRVTIELNQSSGKALATLTKSIPEQIVALLRIRKPEPGAASSLSTDLAALLMPGTAGGNAEDLRQRTDSILKLVPGAEVQFLYDCLVRYAEFLTVVLEGPHVTPEEQDDFGATAYRIFELADCLRRNANRSANIERLVKMTPRALRYAARLCLRLGQAAHAAPKKRIASLPDIEADELWEKSAYYAYHLGSTQPQLPLERVAALLIQASTVRIRGHVESGSDGHSAPPVFLDATMRTLKQVELSLLNFPFRRQLWVRYYMERAYLYYDSAAKGDPQHCATYLAYCQLDLASVRRLAKDCKFWLFGAEQLHQKLDDAIKRDLRSPANTASSAGFDLKVKAVVVGSSRDDRTHLQRPQLRALGMEITGCLSRTMEVSIAPGKMRATKQAVRQSLTPGAAGDPVTFCTARCQIESGTERVEGFIYFPDAVETTEPATAVMRVQVFAPFISGITPGSKLGVHLRSAEFAIEYEGLQRKPAKAGNAGRRFTAQSRSLKESS